LDGLVGLQGVNEMKKIWILVYVWHGLIEEPQIFLDEASAMRRKEEILRKLNRAYDEVEVFEKTIN
jgi:hypothetical protein